MAIANIAVYVLLIGYVLYQRMVGRPVGGPKKLFAVPVIATLIGWGSATRGLTRPLDVVVVVIGSVVAVVFGFWRGSADRLTTRDGFPYVQWTFASLGLFVGNLVVKLIIDGVGIAAGASASAAIHSLVLTLGLTLVGEAIVVWYRSGGANHLNEIRTTAASDR